MNLLKTKIPILISFGVVLAFVMPFTTRLHAQEQPSEPSPLTSCLGENSVQSSLNASEGTYNLKVFYDDSTTPNYSGVIGYIDQNGECIIVEITNGVGTIDFTMNGFVLLELTQPRATTTNNIQVILTSNESSSSACITSDGCTVTVQNREMKLLPNRLSSVFDSVAVYQYKNIENAEIEVINYAIDGKIVYKDKVLEDFNMKYVPSGEHTLQTQVKFDNGAVAVYAEQIENGTITNMFLDTRSWVFQNSTIFTYVGVFISLLIVLAICKWTIEKIRARNMWKAAHDATSTLSKNALKPGKVIKNDAEEKYIIWYFIKKPLFSILIVFVGYVFVSSYIFTLIKTDGISMMNTLEDNQQLAVNRLGETYAKINRSDYIPKRGSVAIINILQDGAVEDIVEDNSLVVKRIIGIPGDTVKLKDGVITVDYIENERPKTLLETEQLWYENVLEGAFDMDVEITLGVGELFVVGDNRDNSIDSRFYGPVKADQVLGEVIKGL